MISGGEGDDFVDPNVHVLDIGVGSSCIYPFLGHRLYGWQFTGSDIDEDSLEWSQGLIERNNLCDAIRLLQVPPSRAAQVALEGWVGVSECQGRRLQRDMRRRGAALNDVEGGEGGARDHYCRPEDASAADSETEEEGVDDVSGTYISSVQADPVRQPSLSILRAVQCSQLTPSDSLAGQTHGHVPDTEVHFLRGPIREALLAMGGCYTQAVRQAEITFNLPSPAASSPIASARDDETSCRAPASTPFPPLDPLCPQGALTAAQTVLTACMSNPPFFTIEEQVIRVLPLLCCAVLMAALC